MQLYHRTMEAIIASVFQTKIPLSVRVSIENNAQPTHRLTTRNTEFVRALGAFFSNMSPIRSEEDRTTDVLHPPFYFIRNPHRRKQTKLSFWTDDRPRPSPLTGRWIMNDQSRRFSLIRIPHELKFSARSIFSISAGKAVKIFACAAGPRDGTWRYCYYRSHIENR